MVSVEYGIPVDGHIVVDDNGLTVCDECKCGSNDLKINKEFCGKRERGRELCETALKTINGERQDQYGSPEDSFQLIAEYWSTYLSTFFNIDLESKDVAHMMTLMKVARMQGQKANRDNYVDAIGYLALAEGM